VGGLLAFAALAALAQDSSLSSKTGAVERRVALMGTTVDVAILAPRREDALAASERVLAELSRVEDLLTTWRSGGPLARLDESPAGASLAVDAELVSVLADVFAWTARTGRAFDPTVLPLVQAWGLRGKGRIPSPEELSAALSATGTDRFRLDPRAGTAARLDPRAGIDEGAWGKGYALDRAAARLREAGVADALIDLGGQVLARGHAAGGANWTIALAHPGARQRPVLTLSLSDTSVSTSGDSERGREVQGRRIGHLLDPRTGQPARDFGSVTVVAPSALTADVLSTALFVLGPEEGLKLSARLRREGVAQEALYLVDREGSLDALASPGFARLVLSTDPAAVRGVKTIPD
jgi:thiamine biosynthesis lipoprotein